MNIDYPNLERDVFDGSFRQQLEEELTVGFRMLRMAGERLPVPSHYASQIAEIINRDAELPEHVKYELYQEVLVAVENAARTVSGEGDNIAT